MKLQNLAIIFIIIILPISLVLAEYTQSRVQTLNLQLSYDTRLYNATYDAIKAFQLNTLNSDTSNQSNSKIRDLQAAVNSFFYSMQTNFSMNGYDKDTLQTHVPALVFTLYDGYYIYSPYKNTLDQETINKLKTGKGEANEYVYDLKPYVYYSCRYKKGSSTDVVITYSLDSYITIKGYVDGNYWNEKGYLLSSVSGNINYRGININTENNIYENVVIDGEINRLPCRKVNGVKYYVKDGKVYTVTNGKKELQSNKTPNFVTQNDNAVQYYKEALELKNKIINSSLISLKASNAVDENGNSITSYDYTNEGFFDYDIFKELNNTNYSRDTQIEDANSNFNAHKLQVIKRSVIRNLSSAITEFNKISNYTTTFEMPKLQDTDWEKITANVGMISFLQGLNIGGKTYNGYTIITNNKNKEFVSEESIYIENNTNTYHRATDLDLRGTSNATGYFNIDYERRTGEILQTVGGATAQVTGYYNPREPATGCYQSIVRQENIYQGKLKNWLAESGNENLKKAYYTALARERYGLYRMENPNDQ